MPVYYYKHAHGLNIFVFFSNPLLIKVFISVLREQVVRSLVSV